MIPGKAKLFIFDMGGVAAHNAAVIPAMAEKLGISEDDFFRGAGSDPGAAFTSPYHLGDIGALMRGEINSRRFWDNFRERTGRAVRGDPWYDCFDPRPNRETAGVITGLRNAGLRVVCGTNTLEAHYRKHRERGDYGIFDAVYASHRMGIIKPSPEFWVYILNQEQADPGAAFFTDDLEENTEAAEKLGIAVHLFTAAEGLAAVLNAGGYLLLSTS
ncbi:MAG: HAD family phosphatase [Treponema sp.]|jgi:putative hydrolase of the HAD superfamily|nr:HAD family phosphatase [Treponema sp.]